ncbi:MAG: hypothetical protein A2X12_08245 [Bacteroidetes bacterium GWE2_29_8]|nr:MAG: hypothetical protein A2X12_08245 [Bacteroidetes bacterium GWE2_29_8]OFY20788.1 MAG: hypothetical protein A2X02_08575 [Bacteroidetes bacterium GWF2_29_10]
MKTKVLIMLFFITTTVILCQNKSSFIDTSKQINLENYNYYELDVKFDKKSNQMIASQRLIWKNNSIKPLYSLPFKLNYNNVDSLIDTVIVNGIGCHFEKRTINTNNYDGFEVILDKPIEPNKECIIKINFKTDEAYNEKDKEIAFYNFWFPSLLFFEKGIFYPEKQLLFNSRMNISYPKKYKIVLTGLTESSYENMGIINVKSYAKEVTGFGIILSKNYLVEEDTVNNIIIKSYYFEDDKKWGHKILEYAKDIVKFYIDTIGFYPQPILSIVPGADYPMGGFPVATNIVCIHRGLDNLKDKAERHAHWITAHEIGHQYWGFNYILEPLDYPHWFGISMGIYTDRLYAKSRKTDETIYDEKFLTPYLGGVLSEINTTIMQTVDTLNKQKIDWNNIIVHGKSYTALELLSNEIGEDVFFKVFKYCIENYKGVNVTFDMFVNTCENISKMDLKNFFNQWYLSNAVLDYRIKDVKITKQDSIKKVLIKIIKNGDAVVSKITVGIKLNNDSLIKLVVNEKGDEFQVEYFTNLGVSEVIIDPDKELPLLIHAENNFDIINKAGNFLRNTGKFNEIIKLYQSLQFDKTLESYWYYIAFSYGHIGNYQAAIENYQHVLDMINSKLLSPDREKAEFFKKSTLLNMGIIYSQMGKNTDAVDCFNKVLLLVTSSSDKEYINQLIKELQ